MNFKPLKFEWQNVKDFDPLIIRHQMTQSSMTVINNCEFKDQDEFLTWIRRLGNTMEFAYTKTNYESVSTINNSKNSVLFPQAGRIWNNIPAGDWHLDVVFTDPSPEFAVLYCETTPEDLGSTWFCDGHLAFNNISPSLANILKQLSITHYRQPKSRYTQEGWEKEYFNSNLESFGLKELQNLKAWLITAMQRATKPLIQKDQIGRECIYISPSKAVKFDGMTEEESQPLIKFLADHLTIPEHIYQHQWKKNQMVLWSNIRFNHYGVYDYHGLDRVLWRTYLSYQTP